MNIDWGDTGTISVDPKQSKVAGNVGFFILPGADEIWNHKTKSWEKFPQVVHSPFMAYGGWVAAVPASRSDAAPPSTPMAGWTWRSVPRTSAPELVPSSSWSPRRL